VTEASGHLEDNRDSVAERPRPVAVAAQLHTDMRERLLAAFPVEYSPHHGHGVGLTGFEYPHVIPGDRLVVEAGSGSWNSR
jgi:hypothetical protein